MSELTKEFERIIEDTSGGTHNSQDWWDMDLCGTETIIEGLCRRLESAALSSIPEPVEVEGKVEYGVAYRCGKIRGKEREMSDRLKLPKVRPERLEDRKRYLAKHNGLDVVVLCVHSERFGVLLTCGDTAYQPSDFDGFWGPIEFELEGEA